MDALYTNFDIDVKAVCMKESSHISLLQIEVLLLKDKHELVFRMIDTFEYKRGDLLSKRWPKCTGSFLTGFMRS